MAHPHSRRRLATVASILLLTTAGLVWLPRNESPPRPAAVKSPPVSPARPIPAAVRTDLNEVWNFDLSGQASSITLALDEAVLRDADGKETLARLTPPATRETLPARLAALTAPGGVLPVAYLIGEVRSTASRRLITPDLRVQLDTADADRIAAQNQLVIKDRPAYAPGWVVMSAQNPFAALAAMSHLRTLREVASADVLLATQHSLRTLPNDPLISSQWHLKRSGTAVVGSDVNIETAWNYPATTGSRGAGIRIGIVDDGLQTAHPDLAQNVDTLNDKDWNGNDADPNPGTGNNHGTACAGNAAARGNNGIGVSGTAPEATLVGMRLVAAAATDAQEAEAMTYLPDLIQIKTNSWGPNDTGTVLEGPGPLTVAALQSAATSGRGGKGSIILWAGGNGGDVGDNSNYDGYANSIYTIAIGATDSDGLRAYYSEPGSNLIVCAPSDGVLGITTVDRTGANGYNSTDYTSTFGGTSSACPTAAGIVALMLEKNPNLGWRDVQEILIRTAVPPPASTGWVTNGAGFPFNHDFGAGLIDATAAVNLAATWTALPAQISAASTQTGLAAAIPNNTAVGTTRSFDLSATHIRVEHVTLKLSATHSARGDLEITLTSPGGMISKLAQVHGDTGDDYSNWTFSSVRHWGEISTGTWTLKVADLSSTGNTTGGTLTAAELKIFGSSAAPVITAASLSASGQSYTDVPLTVTSITASDPEGDPLSYFYQWQSSTNQAVFTAESGATLATAPALSGKLLRCKITASDGTSSSTAFTTAAVNLLTRPGTLAEIGSGYSYTSGLVLRSADTSLTRRAIIHEFSQGPAGLSSEWIEILTLQSGSLASWNLHDAGANTLFFLNAPVWSNIPAGTLIVVYNGNSKDPLLPADDLDPADGRMIVSSTNSAYFAANSAAWLPLSNSGDSIFLADPTGIIVHSLAYGNSTATTPNIGNVGSASSAHFTGDTDASANLAANWQTTTANAATPAAPNNPANLAFVTALRDGSLSSPPLFRIGSGAVIPTGLSLDSHTGILAGTLDPGNPATAYPIVIERYNSLGEIVSQSYTLTLSPAATYAAWISGYAVGALSGLNDDPDQDGLPNGIENYLGTAPDSANPGLTPVSATATTLVFRHRRSQTPATDLTASYEWSADLVTWQPSSAAPVTITAAPVSGLIEVTATVTGPPEQQLFVRLKVVR